MELACLLNVWFRDFLFLIFKKISLNKMVESIIQILIFMKLMNYYETARIRSLLIKKTCIHNRYL
jgi:hypothetical protein